MKIMLTTHQIEASLSLVYLGRENIIFPEVRTYIGLAIHSYSFGQFYGVASALHKRGMCAR